MQLFFLKFLSQDAASRVKQSIAVYGKIICTLAEYTLKELTLSYKRLY